MAALVALSYAGFSRSPWSRWSGASDRLVRMSRPARDAAVVASPRGDGRRARRCAVGATVDPDASLLERLTDDGGVGVVLLRSWWWRSTGVGRCRDAHRAVGSLTRDGRRRRSSCSGSSSRSRRSSSSARPAAWPRSRRRCCSRWTRRTTGSSSTCPTSVAATLTPDDVRRILGFQVGVLQAQGRVGQRVGGATDRAWSIGRAAQRPSTTSCERAAATGEAYIPEQVDAVVETQLDVPAGDRGDRAPPVRSRRRRRPGRPALTSTRNCSRDSVARLRARATNPDQGKEVVHTMHDQRGTLEVRGR